MFIVFLGVKTHSTLVDFNVPRGGLHSTYKHMEPELSRDENLTLVIGCIYGRKSYPVIFRALGIIRSHYKDPFTNQSGFNGMSASRVLNVTQRTFGFLRMLTQPFALRDAQPGGGWRILELSSGASRFRRFRRLECWKVFRRRKHQITRCF